MKSIKEIWIDAHDFKTTGGWKLDTQFVHQTCGGFLIAANEPGVPVADARIGVNIPQSDNYRVWVRDRNWLRSHSPGRFILTVNGKESAILGAQPSDAWVWEIAGDFKLEKGDCDICLHDLTGYFGRCSSILITNDFDYTPSREKDMFLRERARIKGIDAATLDGGDFDVIVAGGGPGGVPAAIAAARGGAKTLIIHDRPALGGNAGKEVGITMDGAGADNFYARETGIAEEIRRLRDTDPEFSGDWTRAMEKLVAAERNITVVYNMHLCGAETDKGVIKAVTAFDMFTLQKTRYTAKMFIDCTGDGWLGYYAGAKYRYGREARYEYNESLAPETADTVTMSGCIKSGNLPFFETTDHPVEYHAPEWVPKLPETDEEFAREIAGSGRSMAWWLEVPGTYDDMWDGEEARDALFLVILGYIDHIKNYWSQKERAQNCRFIFSGIFNGRRESRRLIGDYVLTQDDCINGRSFPDAISYAGWTLDIHNAGGIYSGRVGPVHCARHISKCQIPYRCLYSVNVDNLLFAGRCVSATHLAIGTLRVENTIATMGQAAGTAAAMCLKLAANPRGIYKEHIKELQQQLLRDDQFIPGVYNTDKDDPCLTAAATASSYSTKERFNTIKGVEGELLPMNVARLTSFDFMRESGDITAVWLKLYSSHDKPWPVKMHTDNKAFDAWCYNEFKDNVTVEALVPPGESWVKFPVKIAAGGSEALSRRMVQLYLEPAEGISWRARENLSFHWRRGELREDGSWKLKGTCGMCATVKDPDLPFADCRPQNVINGLSRVTDPERYEWVSDPEQPLPQWIELTFKKPEIINAVSAVFDTDLSNPATCWTCKIPAVPLTVKDYYIELFSNGKWITVANEKDNFMRKRTHSFAPVTAEKLRVTVTATNGDKSARIMEIRAQKAP